MNIRKSNDAVSEVLGTVLLLGMTVSLFSLLSFTVLSYPFTPSSPSVNLVGYMEETNTTGETKVILEHYGGESLAIITTKVMLIIQETNVNITGSLIDSNNNALWDLGERLSYPVWNVTGKQVEVTVVDTKSNSIIMSGILQEEGTL
jgi:FlaG/FlaF family flagellin (archaellin)